MKRFSITLAVGLILLTSYSTALAQRRGGGRSMGGGGRSFGGGGMSMSARPAARPMPSRSMGGGFSSAARMAPRSAPIASQMPARSGQHFSGVGPGGGSFQAGRGSGSFTTQGGATVDYGGRGAQSNRTSRCDPRSWGWRRQSDRAGWTRVFQSRACWRRPRSRRKCDRWFTRDLTDDWPSWIG